MDSFFGIGLFELVMIAVVALLVLGPERLPGAMREVAKWMRQLRSISSEFQSQFSEEFKMLDEINPRRIINEALDPNAQPKPAPGQPAKPPAGQAAAKPLAARPVTPPAPKPAAATAAKPVNAAFPNGPTVAAATTAAAAAAAQAGANAAPDGEMENTILPPAQSAVAPELPAARADSPDTGSQSPAAPAAAPAAAPTAAPAANAQESEAAQ